MEIEQNPESHPQTPHREIRIIIIFLVASEKNGNECENRECFFEKSLCFSVIFCKFILIKMIKF